MPSDKKFVEYVSEQMELAGLITTRPMMGEYLVYCDGIYVGLVSDNAVFMKPTEAGRQYIGNVVEKPAYPGAKPSFCIGSELENKRWLGGLIRVTRDELSKTKRPARRSVRGKKTRRG